MHSIIRFTYIALFIFVSSLVIYVSHMYKKDLADVKIVEYFTNKSKELNKEINKLILNREENQLLIVQQLVLDNKVLHIMKTKEFDADSVKYISDRLERGAGLKDTWFQFIDKKGISIARSWNNKRGDDLSAIRDDVLSMINKPRIINSISVGWYDMTFKTMMPIYDEKHRFLGAMELISNFDSISEKLEKQDYRSVFLVDKKYKKQLKYPRTGKFVKGYYVANQDADEQLLSVIKNKGLDHFISPYHSYVIEDDRVVFNYALFDKKEQLIANFLLFKKLSSFDLNEINETKTRINIATGIILLLMLVGFYVLSISNIATIELDRSFYKLTALFMIVYFLYFILVSLYYKDQKDRYISSYNNQIKIDFDNIKAKYASMAELIFKTDIQTPAVLKALKSAQADATRDQAREALYDVLKYDYELFKTVGVRQLHFHLKNNESFLRFHKPREYGDDLSGIRETVMWVNRYHEKVEGFEEGVHSNGFRYIYPIFDEYDPSNIFYLGSVEVSFSSFYFIRDLAQSYNFRSTLLVKTDIIKKKTLKGSLSYYTDSNYMGWSFDRAISEKLKNLSIDADLSLVGNDRYQYIKENIEKGEIFSIETDEKNNFFTFIPLQNPITKKVIGVLVLQKDKGLFVTLHNNTYIALLVGFIFLLFVFLYMYKEISIKKQYRLLLRKTQRILDTQDSIIIILDDKEIIDVNKKFLDFFGFDSLYEFNLHYSCITDKFLDDSRLFDLHGFEDKKEWVRELEKMDSKDKIVSMMDKNGEVHFFSIKDSKLDDNYLLEFSDISDTMKDKFQFINKAYKDHLTQAYNREYFDSHINKIIDNLKYNDVLGIIFCDIDYFKNVNDTYGHEVGDKVLKQMIDIIRKNTRSDDIIVRWGGEEFVIFLYVESMDILIKIANNLREAIEKELFEEVGSLTCSFGLSQYMKGEKILESIKRADEALYEAKASGRNRVRFKF